MTHTFFLGRDNEQALELREGPAGGEQNLTLERYDALTRITLTLRPLAGGPVTTLDSGEHAGVFAWGSSGPGRRLVLEGAALAAAGVVAGSYRARLVVYSADQAQGIVWLDFPDYGIEIRE